MSRSSIPGTLYELSGNGARGREARSGGLRHPASKGSAPVLSSEEAALVAGVDISTIMGPGDRAVVAVMTYAFAHVGAVVAFTVEDYFPQRKRWWLRLLEKNSKVDEMPCHHKLEEYLDA